MKFSLFATVLAIAILSPSLAFAGKEAGNGGQGVVIEDRVFLLDLVESGLEKDPFFLPGAVGTDQDRRTVQVALGGLNAPIALITAKLAELYAISPSLSRVLVTAMEIYAWRPVHAPLEEIPDREGILDPGAAKFVQLAVRSGRTIRIDRDLWARLDQRNQTALIFHEVIYALMPLTEDSRGLKSQNSVRAREITAYLFSPELHERGLSGLRRILGSSAPLTDFELKTSPSNPEKNLFTEEMVTALLKVTRRTTSYDLVFQWPFRERAPEAVSELCERVADPYLRKSAAELLLDVTFSRVTKSLQFVEYLSPRGPQTALSVEPSETDGLDDWKKLLTLDLKRDPRTPSPAECYDWFRKLVEQAT